MPASGDVRLTIVDVTGRQVRVLQRGRSAAGDHTASWDLLDDSGRRVAPGLYFAALMTNGTERRARVVVLE